MMLEPMLVGWLLVSAAAGLVWRRRERPTPPPPRWLAQATSAAIILVLLICAQVGVTVIASSAPPAAGPVAWVGLGCAAASAVIAGGAVTTTVLSLSDTTADTRVSPNGVLIKRDLLRGGTWIGVLERIGILAALLTWREGVALILAIKGLARYPELKAGPTSGAAERFIIGTLISFGWAAGCAGIAWLILH